MLIAACHVLHRLYVPRHPRIALTSRLRVHTTNDITGCPFGSPTRQSSASRPLSGADDYNLSQIIYMMMSVFGPANRLSDRVHAEALLRTAEAILNVQNQTPHGIDFKNPFTMSNTTGIARQSPLSRAANRFSSSTWICGERVALAAPVSRSEAAPCGRASRRWPCLAKCELAG
jgi:hypothetical protein